MFTKRYWLGRPPLWETPEALEAEIQGFLNAVKAGDEAPSIVGLACWLGTSKQTLANYEKREQFGDLITAAKQQVEKLFTAAAYAGDIPPALFIFTAKNNYGYRDKTDHEITGAGGGALTIALTDNDNAIIDRFLETRTKKDTTNDSEPD